MNRDNLIVFAVIAAMTYLVMPLDVLITLIVLGTIIGSAVYITHRRHHSAHQVRRWGRRTIRKHGVASTLDILRTASFLAMRRQAKIVRPSVTNRLRCHILDIATPLCRVGWLRVWESIEGVVGVFGGPRTGKSGYLLGRILDAPGAVLSTSTRLDLLHLTRRLRSRKGPVYVFNPVGLGDEPNTIRFDPLWGCKDPTTAIERAHDMITLSANTKSEREHWVNQGRAKLAVFMHAAALGNKTMFTVAKWVSDPAGNLNEVSNCLRLSPEPTFLAEAVQFARSHDGPRTSITTTIMPALMWLTRPAAVMATAVGTQFDIQNLLDTKAAVYLLGTKEAQTAPLVSALTGYIAREARRLAALSPGGRLDPSLTLVLDEAAVICPVPLDSWTADMGGRGIHIIYACQSRAQVLATYGDTGAAAIINNTSSVLIFGGTRDRADLEFWSHLAGYRDEQVPSYDKAGNLTSLSTRSVPVIASAQFANLPRRAVVCFRRGMPPTVGRAKMGWHRADVRLARVTGFISHHWGTPAPALDRLVVPAPAPAGKPVGTQVGPLDAGS